MRSAQRWVVRYGDGLDCEQAELVVTYMAGRGAGAHCQPWKFLLVQTAAFKEQIRALVNPSHCFLCCE